MIANGASTYSWTDGTNNYSGNNITVSPTTTTTYTVTGTSGTCSATSTVSITVNQLPSITVSASPNIICNGESSILSASGANTYNWSNGATGSNVTVTPSATTHILYWIECVSAATSTVSCTINQYHPSQPLHH